MDLFLFFIRLFVRRKARRTSSGELAAAPAASVKILVIILLLLFGWLTLVSYSGKKGGQGMLTGISVMLAVTAGSVWWRVLRWTDDTLFVRPAFRRGRRYRWDDIRSLRGDQKSWVLEMTDGRVFKANEWTSGAGEFLDHALRRAGISPSRQGRPIKPL